MDKVRAILLTHEHIDHIRGVERLSNRYKLPVYITSKTLKFSRLQLSADQVREFSHAETFAVEDIRITPFRKKHDAADPHSFILEYNDATVGVLTDIGSGCENVIEYLSRCHALFLEANYDEQMLQEGSYPFHLKKRISGGMGHLSNHQALQLAEQYAAPFLKQIYLSHLSRENNHPDRALHTFSSLSQRINISVATRYEPTPVYQVSASATSLNTPEIPTGRQLSLF